MSPIRSNLAWIVISAISLSFIGCSKDSNNDSIGLKDPGSAQLTTISSEKDAVAAAQSVFGLHNTTDSIGNDIPTSSIGFSKLVNLKLPGNAKIDPNIKEAFTSIQKVLAKPTNRVLQAKSDSMSMSAKQTTNEQACDIDGSMVITIDDSSTSSSVTTTYKNCKESTYNNGYEVTNGTIKFASSSNADSTATSLEMTLGNGDATLEDSDLVSKTYDANSSLLDSSIVSMKLTMKSDTSQNNGALSVKINGRAELTDNVQNTVETISIDHASLDVNAGVSITNQTVDSGDLSFTVNGAMEVVLEDNNTTTSPDQRAYIGASDLSYTWSVDSSQVSSETLDGKFVVENTPAQCGDGAYNIQTVAAMKRDSSDTLIAGEMNINDNTTIKVNADGTITVTVSGTATNYTDEADMRAALDGVCTLTN